MNSNTLDHFCRDLKACSTGNKIVIAISGMDRFCTQIARDALKKGGHSLTIMSKEAVQDSYAFLFMGYGIRTNDICNREELSHYICDIYWAVAKLSHYRNEGFLESVLPYKRKKAARAAAPVILSRDNRNLATNTEENDIESEHEEGTSLKRFTKTPSHMYLTKLSLIPGVSNAKAEAIYEKYPTHQYLVNALQNSAIQDDLLSGITFGGTNRRIGFHISQTVAKLYTYTDPTTEIVRRQLSPHMKGIPEPGFLEVLQTGCSLRERFKATCEIHINKNLQDSLIFRADISAFINLSVYHEAPGY